MPVSYPKELSLSYWRTKKSRLVSASDLEKLLADLEKQFKAIDQSKLHASGYRQLTTAEDVTKAAEDAAKLRKAKVPPHLKSLSATQLEAKKTIDRMVRAKTVPKADIDLVRNIEKYCEQLAKAWKDPAENGEASFAKELKSIDSKLSPMVGKVESAIKAVSGAVKDCAGVSTVPYWLIGKDPRLPKAGQVGDKCLSKQCARLQKLLESHPSLSTCARSFEKFADDYPRKQKRIRITDPKLEASAPDEFEKQLRSEKAAVAACLVELGRELVDLKKKLQSI